MWTDRTLAELVGAAYEAAHVPLGYSRFVSALRRHLGARYVGFATSAVDLPSATVTDGVDTVTLREYGVHYCRLDPYCARVASLHAGELRATQDLVAPEELRKSEFYNDFLSKADIGDGFAGLLGLSNTGSSVLTVLFESRTRERSNELALLQLLMPHVQRSLIMHRQMLESRAALATAEFLLDGLGCAAFVVNDECDLIRTNSAADRLLAARDGVIAIRRRLAAIHAEDDRTLRREVAHALILRAPAVLPRPIRLQRP